jgi:hypothetical protein
LGKLKSFRELKTESLGTISVVDYDKTQLVFLRRDKGENLKVIRHLNLNPLIAYVQISGVLLKGVKILDLFEEFLPILKMSHTFRTRTVNAPSPKKGIRKSGMNVTKAASIACSSQ